MDGARRGQPLTRPRRQSDDDPEDPTFRELPDPLESAPPGAAGERPARR